MVVKSVGKGEAITAFWANSLVNAVNMTGGTHLSGRSIPRPSMRNVQLASEPAFQIRYTKSGQITLNAGQIYINGLLVGSGSSESEPQAQGEEVSKHSYNQFSSIKNWNELSIHDITKPDDLPEWYVVITGPKIVTKANIGEVEATLVKQTKGQSAPEAPKTNSGGNTGGTSTNPGGSTENQPNEEEEKLWICIQISKVEGTDLLQLVSGSIYLSTTTVSLVGGDGIMVEPNEDGSVQTVSLYVSFIGDDHIEVIESYIPQKDTPSTEEGEPQTQAEGEGDTTEPQQPQKPVKQLKVIQIKQKTPFSFVGTDGITVQDYLWAEPQKEDGTYDHRRVITISGMSHIGRDGITVTEEDLEETVTDATTGVETTVTKRVLVFSGSTSNVSFIGIDGIEVTDEFTQVKVESNTENPDGGGNSDGGDPIVTTKDVRLVTIRDIHSFIGQDGIKVEETTAPVEITDATTGETRTVNTKLVTIKNENNYSFVGQDGVEVSTTDEEVEASDGTKTKKKVVTITAKTDISFIGVDEIKVTQEEVTDETTGKKSQKVTIGHEKLEEINITGEDGIVVESKEEVETTATGCSKTKKTFTIKGSPIADVNIDIRGGDNVTVEKTTENTTQVFTISADVPESERINLVEGDNIEIKTNGSTHTISCTVSAIGYDFDDWFIVTDKSISLNEAKLTEVAQSVAPSVSSQIVSTTSATLDTWTDDTGYAGYSGSIQATINTTSGESANCSINSVRD